MKTKKDKLLGMSHSTAANQLRKAIMFQLVQQSGRDTCHQCGQTIETVDDLSIEHIDPWQSAEEPLETFFDLNNIAFSHLRCNISAAKRSGNPNPYLGRETAARLTKEQASEVKRLLRDGAMSQRAIGRMYGVHHSSIQAIANGVSWADA